MAAVINIVSRCGLRIKAYYINQSNKTKLALYKLLLPIQESFKTVVYNYVITQKHFSYRGGCGVHVSRYLK